MIRGAICDGHTGLLLKFTQNHLKFLGAPMLDCYLVLLWYPTRIDGFQFCPVLSMKGNDPTAASRQFERVSLFMPLFDTNLMFPRT